MTTNSPVAPSSLYQAPWPEALKPTMCRKLQRAAFNFFSLVIFPIGLIRMLNHWVVRPLMIRLAILPLTGFNNGTSHPTFKTASGEVITATYTPKEGAEKLILAVGGNCQTAQDMCTRMGNLVGDTSISVLAVNPIGADGSSGFPGRNGLDLSESTGMAVYSAYEYAINTLKIKKENILVYGTSWGGVGAVLGAGHIQRKYGVEAVKIVNDRSLKSTSAVAAAHTKRFLKLTDSPPEKNASCLRKIAHLFKRVIKAVLRGVVGIGVGIATRVAGLQVDAGAVWNRLKTTNKCVVYSESDEVIPFKEASLHHPNVKNPSYKTVVYQGDHNSSLPEKTKNELLDHIKNILNIENGKNLIGSSPR